MQAPAEHPGARIVALDDDAANLELVARMLSGVGYTDVTCFHDAETALAHLHQHDVDLLLLDMHMPVPGIAVLDRLRGNEVTVVCLTGDGDRELRRQALDLGAADFLLKPFDAQEVVLRVRNLLRERRARGELRIANDRLEQRVRERTVDLVDARNEVLERLSRAAEFRDDDTHEHTMRVGVLARAIACDLGTDPAWADMLGQVAPLHDLGKIGVPDAVLLKPARLSAEEFEVVKRHTSIGATILSGGRTEVMQLAEEVARTHHERWDGNGYLGMRATGIPLSGRIVAVADVFDALTHVRPYKHAWAQDEAREEILVQRGRHFDPDVVDSFIRLLDARAL